MSIPPGAPGRGCAACYPQPVNEEQELAAQILEDTVEYYNRRVRRPINLPEIIYRESDRNIDILHPVFRWDPIPYQEVFIHGLNARRQEGTSDSTYFDLDRYVHHGGRPVDSRRTTTHAFVGTTLNIAWQPNLSLETLPEGGRIEIYRYEIYAPGGIYVALTFGDAYGFPVQDEVAFVAGIAPTYIRSAQLYIVTRARGRRDCTYRRANDELIINRNFNPITVPGTTERDPDTEYIIQNPIFDYIDEEGDHEIERRRLRYVVYPPPPPMRKKRQVSNDNSDAALKWYSHDVAEIHSYINAAFRSSRTNEAYIFMKNQYALLNYAPGTTDDRIVNGPLLICDGYPSLISTPFGEYGIDCAFDTDDHNKAFIFSGKLCAYIDYAPGTTDDKIISGPMTIKAMFPFFKDTVFEKGIDAAFKSSRSNEAYLFRGDQYAIINYNSKDFINIRNITQGFYSLKGTIFENGIDAAFASHRYNEAYIFKGDQYALINFAPGTTDDYIIGGVKPILPNWPSLGSILPRKNYGIDVHIHHDHEHYDQPDRDHDEL